MSLPRPGTRHCEVRHALQRGALVAPVPLVVADAGQIDLAQALGVGEDAIAAIRPFLIVKPPMENSFPSRNETGPMAPSTSARRLSAPGV